MSDEPPKENPETPEPQQPTPSIWNTFNKNRVEKPRDIREEVKAEFKNADENENEIADLAEASKRLGEKYLKIFEKIRDGSSTELISGNRDVYLTGEGGGWDPNEPGDPSEDWKPDRIVVNSGSSFGLDDKNKRMHNKTLRGEIFPEYFKDLDGEVWRINNNYVYDRNTGKWNIFEEFYSGIHIPSYVRKKIFDPDALTVIDPKVIYSKFTEDELEDSKDHPEHMRDLDMHDFEQLQTIVVEISTGELKSYQGYK